jgi:hypothetical protein
MPAAWLDQGFVSLSDLAKLFSGTDTALTTVANQTPNLANLNPYPVGTYGNLGDNNLKGPGCFSIEPGLIPNFPDSGNRERFRCARKHSTPATSAGTTGS